MEDATRVAGLEDLETYISRIQNTVIQYIYSSSILDLILVAYKLPGTQVVKLKQVKSRSF